MSRFYRHYGKRLFDLVIVIPILLLTIPLLVLLVVLIYLRLGTPVLFRQQRPGFRGQTFTILKFRTMNNVYDNSGNLLPDEERLVSIGRILRSTSLDELPELINILKGEMSFVGPRPLLMEYIPLYTPEQMRRHEVKPGMTGWAQVNGRNALSWEEKFALDLWYVENQSFWLDLKIILLTIVKILKREGISQPGHVTI